MEHSTEGFIQPLECVRISDAHVVLDNDWRYIHVSQRAGEILGRNAGDLLGKPIWSETPEWVGQPFQRAAEQAMAGQNPVHVDVFHRLGERWFEHCIHPSPGRVEIHFHDVTVRKQLEEALHQSRRMLSESQHVARMGSWEWDTVTNALTWSAGLYRIYGLQSQDFATFDNYLALVHPDDRACVLNVIECATRDHHPFEFEERIVRADGSIRILHSCGRVQVNAAGMAVRLLGTCQDITERKRAEQMDAGQHDILAGIAAQRPLAESLARIAQLHEALNPGAMCSVLLLDNAGERVLHGAAPSLPDAYNQAIHGLQIGDAIGSCGTAAWRRERVVVADIPAHPYWKDYRPLAATHGLQACWSTPVLGVDGRVLGTFAVYYREPREPSLDELRDIDRLLPITGIAIESANLIGRLHERDRFFDLSVEIYCILDPQSERMIQVNPSFCLVTGYNAKELTSRHYLEFIHPEDRPLTAEAVAVLKTPSDRISEYPCRFLCKAGNYRWLQWEAVTAVDGLAYAVAIDITDHRRVEEELTHAANHDSITGLPHHLLLESALSQMLEDGAAESVWVLFAGIDRFNVVNDSMGHVMGDDVLQRLGQRMREALGADAQIARFSGDEFIIAARDLSQAEALALAERLRATVAEPIEGHDYKLMLTASIGISHSLDHSASPKDLVRRAEAAMRVAKQEGRDSVREFTVEQMQGIEDRLTLGSHLREALRTGEFELHYQPQYSSGRRTLNGFEALLRWRSRRFGNVSPGRFIPIAEALGLMPELGAWVLDAACRQASEWLQRGHRAFTIAVNVSAQQLQRSGLVEQVRDAIARHSIPPEIIDIELTESSLMENVGRVQQTLADLKALGIILSLDDFGTGYSSLAYLKHFPIDKLKIDQRFVRGLPDDADDAAIAQTIIVMAHQLRMVVAAEGVENLAQAEFLTGIGCDELQGYYFGRPIPALEAEQFFSS